MYIRMTISRRMNGGFEMPEMPDIFGKKKPPVPPPVPPPVAPPVANPVVAPIVAPRSLYWWEKTKNNKTKNNQTKRREFQRLHT